MAITKEQKHKLVAQYAQLIDESRALFLTEYTGLTVKEMQDLRAKIRTVDGAYHITKNTLFKIALTDAEKPVPDDLLLGQVATGFALGEVPALAKALVDYAKTDDSFRVKGGIVGDAVLSTEQVEALADLPSLDQLRAQIIGLLSTPARNIAGTVASGVRQVVNVVDAYAKSESENAEVLA